MRRGGLAPASYKRGRPGAWYPTLARRVASWRGWRGCEGGCEGGGLGVVVIGVSPLAARASFRGSGEPDGKPPPKLTPAISARISPPGPTFSQHSRRKPAGPFSICPLA